MLRSRNADWVKPHLEATLTTREQEMTHLSENRRHSENVTMILATSYSQRTYLTESLVQKLWGNVVTALLEWLGWLTPVDVSNYAGMTRTKPWRNWRQLEHNLLVSDREDGYMRWGASFFDAINCVNGSNYISISDIGFWISGYDNDNQYRVGCFAIETKGSNH